MKPSLQQSVEDSLLSQVLLHLWALLHLQALRIGRVQKALHGVLIVVIEADMETPFISNRKWH